MLKIDPMGDTEQDSITAHSNVPIKPSGFSEEELEEIFEDIEYYAEHPEELKKYSNLDELFKHWFSK